MTAVDIVLPSTGVRLWHRILADRLEAAGHSVSVVCDESGSAAEPVLDAVLFFESHVLRRKERAMTAPVAPFSRRGRNNGEVTIDLRTTCHRNTTGGNPPVLGVLFDGERNLSRAAATLALGRVPDLTLTRDGRTIARAAPMASSRAFVALGLEDVLGRAITMIVHNVDTTNEPISEADRPPDNLPRRGQGLAANYLFSSLPRLCLRFADRLVHHGDHWRVGYRFIDGPGVAETGTLAGKDWQILPDDRQRFYADPFPVETESAAFIFVEEYEHASGKGVISVSRREQNGAFGVPEVVLEEPFHLSYPQVFRRGDTFWMIPESGAGAKLSLYRAERFPDRWIEHRVLVDDREIYDATLIEEKGIQYLVGAERDGAGSGSDIMVVYLAEQLEGEWRPHPMNPIAIDRAAARPGGRATRVGNELVLPLQDGTDRYGGGLGLSRIVRLDPEYVEIAEPAPIAELASWPYPRIHTLNRWGRLETIDGLARVRKPQLPGVKPANTAGKN